jgi:hypothetical protein
MSTTTDVREKEHVAAANWDQDEPYRLLADEYGTALMGAIAVPLNLWLARNYQRRIDALDTVLMDNREADKKEQEGVS